MPFRGGADKWFLDNAVHLELELWVHMREMDGAGAVVLFSGWC